MRSRGVCPSHAAAAGTPGYSAVLLDKQSGIRRQTAVNAQTKQQWNIPLRRGKEWHAPDKMMLNRQHIVMVEPVTAGSTVAKLMEQADNQGGRAHRMLASVNEGVPL